MVSALASNPTGPRVPFAAPEPRPVSVFAWASAGGSSGLECSAVRLAAIPYRVSPGFSSVDAGMYVRAAALHCRSPPLSAVLPSEGGRCAVADARCHGVLVSVLHGEGCGLLLGVTTLALSFG